MSQANFEAENIIWKNEWIKIWNWKPYEKTHQTVHEGCKIFKCESFGKSFTQVDFLSRHIEIIHSGHKDFKCDSWGKSFLML